MSSPEVACGFRYDPNHCVETLSFHVSEKFGVIYSGKSVSKTKDSFITQDRNDDFEGGQVESTFS